MHVREEQSSNGWFGNSHMQERMRIPEISVLTGQEDHTLRRARAFLNRIDKAIESGVEPMPAERDPGLVRLKMRNGGKASISAWSSIALRTPKVRSHHPLELTTQAFHDPEWLEGANDAAGILEVTRWYRGALDAISPLSRIVDPCRSFAKDLADLCEAVTGRRPVRITLQPPGPFFLPTIECEMDGYAPIVGTIECMDHMTRMLPGSCLLRCSDRTRMDARPSATVTYVPEPSCDPTETLRTYASCPVDPRTLFDADNLA
jgi:hypothetical protein